MCASMHKNGPNCEKSGIFMDSIFVPDIGPVFLGASLRKIGWTRWKDLEEECTEYLFPQCLMPVFWCNKEAKFPLEKLGTAAI